MRHNAQLVASRIRKLEIEKEVTIRAAVVLCSLLEVPFVFFPRFSVGLSPLLD